MWRCVSNGRLNLYKLLNPPAVGDRVVNTAMPYNPSDPSTYWTTIQAAINDANEGEELIASAGFMYPENIDFLGKAITLRSGNILNYSDANMSPEDTWIFGGYNGSVVTFWNGEGVDTVLKGFTIRRNTTARFSGISI